LFRISVELAGSIELIETPAIPLVKRSSRMRRCSAAVASETTYISVL
jgi:hypothetical protein